MRLHSLLPRLLLIALLVIPITSGDLLHAVVPHTHSANAAVADDMHSLFRHEDKDLLVLPTLVIFFTLLALALFIPFSRRALSLNALLIRARHQQSTALRRGVMRYRRFG